MRWVVGYIKNQSGLHNYSVWRRRINKTDYTVGCEADKNRENFISFLDAKNKLNTNSLSILKEKKNAHKPRDGNSCYTKIYFE